MAINQMMSGLGGAFSNMGTSSDLASIQQAQSAASDQNQAAQIQAQMQSEQQKTQAQIHQIEQETNTKVAEMFRESNLNKAKSSSKLHDKWVQQIMS